MDTVNSLCYSKDSGFLLGIFFRGGGEGAKSIAIQISFVMLLFSDQISGKDRSFQGEQTTSGGALCPPLWKEARGSEGKVLIHLHLKQT